MKVPTSCYNKESICLFILLIVRVCTPTCWLLQSSNNMNDLVLSIFTMPCHARTMNYDERHRLFTLSSIDYENLLTFRWWGSGQHHTCWMVIEKSTHSFHHIQLRNDINKAKFNPKLPVKEGKTGYQISINWIQLFLVPFLNPFCISIYIYKTCRSVVIFVCYSVFFILKSSIRKTWTCTLNLAPDLYSSSFQQAFT